MRSKKALYSIIFSLIFQAIAVIYGFIVPKIIISNYGSEVNGLISSISQFLAYIALLESGIGPVVKSALYKPLTKKNDEEINNILYSANKFFKTIASIFILYIIILIFVYPLIINGNFEYLFTSSLILIISISTFAEYYFGAIYSLFLQADQKQYVISIIKIISYILSCILIVILSKFNVDIRLLKLVSSLVFVLRPIILNIYVKKKYNINFKKCNKNYVLKQKWDGLAQHIAAVVHNNTDITVLTVFCNLLEVSVYSIYLLVVNGIKSVINSITSGLDASFGDMFARGEKDNLNQKFSMYEFVYYSITAIIYGCTLLLITSFVKVYTLGISDTNYIRPLFAVLLVSSEMMWSIRLPYSSLTLSAGHFKETRRGAWIESLTNIGLSIILVFKFGIIGVAIGTLVAMFIRTIEFVYHCNKYILDRSQLISIKRILILLIEIGIIYLIGNNFNLLNVSNYIDWIKNAVKIGIVSIIIVIPVNIIIFKKDFNVFIGVVKRLIKRKVK